MRLALVPPILENVKMWQNIPECTVELIFWDPKFQIWKVWLLTIIFYRKWDMETPRKTVYLYENWDSDGGITLISHSHENYGMRC